MAKLAFKMALFKNINKEPPRGCLVLTLALFNDDKLWFA
jgi:hypothetical protein